MRVVKKRFAIASPVNTHTRLATCEEVDCEYNQRGWRTRVETLPSKEAYKVATTSGRYYTESQEAPGETYLVFPPGQQCFADHRLPLDRPEFYYVGDRQGTRRHSKSEFWVEEHSEDLDRLKKKIEQ